MELIKSYPHNIDDTLLILVIKDNSREYKMSVEEELVKIFGLDKVAERVINKIKQDKARQFMFLHTKGK
jgi:hypothetical protein